MIPGLMICMSRDEQTFVLVHNCAHPRLGCATEYGPLERKTRSQMEMTGLASVLRSLNEYPRRRKVEKSELESLSIAEQDKFDHEHKQVSVSLQKNGELWLAPMHLTKHGGRVSGDMSETQIITLPTTPSAFFGAVNAAMALAD